MTEHDESNELDTDLDTDTSEDSGKKNWRRQLEADAADGRKAKQEAAAARRELAFLKAGIDLNTPSGKLFVKAYDGDASVDAVKAAATEYGLLKSEEQEQALADEVAAHERIGAAANVGGVAPTVLDEAAERIGQAQSAQEVIDAFIKAGGTIDGQQPGSWFYSDSIAARS